MDVLSDYAGRRAPAYPPSATEHTVLEIAADAEKQCSETSSGRPSGTISEGSSAYTAVTIEKPDATKDAKAVSQRAEDEEEFELPEKKSRVRRASKLPFFSQYRRLAATIALINIALLAVVIAGGAIVDLPVLGYMIIANIFVAVVMRQQRIINFLFWIATRPCTHWPLAIRWRLGKIYHFGGLHSGCSVAATVWFAIFTVAATYNIAAGRAGISAVTLAFTYLIALALIFIVVLALPPLRAKFHNTFEVSHRFLGWSVLALVWVHAILLINDSRDRAAESLASAVARSPTPYLLAIMTLSIASTWITLRKVPVQIVKPSNHAVIVKFDERVSTPFPGSSSTISLDPLTEWHSFANIPKKGENSFRLIISRAGDWTSRIIDNPPTHFYLKGIATAGVANIEVLFKRVLYVATGSGIGPVLPHLLAKEVPSHLFWSTRSPLDTYGQDLVDEIMEASPDAVVHDTMAQGKPDMVSKTYSLVRKFDAEAVIIISNQKLTRKVVYGMESRGIPAFGAIWDS